MSWVTSLKKKKLLLLLCVRENYINVVVACGFYWCFLSADSCMAWLTEVVLLGGSDARIAELNLTQDTRTLLELALGSTRGPAGSLWQKMEEYANSKGTPHCIYRFILDKTVDLLPIWRTLYVMDPFCVFFSFCFSHLGCCSISTVLSALAAEWESGGSSGDYLLQVVCRCSLAALLKHTGLQKDACWQDRSVDQIQLFWKLSFIFYYYKLKHLLRAISINCHA